MRYTNRRLTFTLPYLPLTTILYYITIFVIRPIYSWLTYFLIYVLPGCFNLLGMLWNVQISPDTPVLLAGTKADLVRSSSGNAFVDIWSTVSALLDAGRGHHYRRYATPLADELAAFTGSRPSSSCLLCCRRGVAGTTGGADVQRRTYPKSRVGGIGFVDALHSAAAVTASSTAGVHGSAAVNGHAYPPTADDVGPGRGGSARYPHVVGYYEIDARVKKDSKVGHHYSVDWLRDAVGRITLVSPSSRHHGTGCRIPRSWYSVLRRMTDCKIITRPPSSLAPYVLCDELRTLARACDVPPSQVICLGYSPPQAFIPPPG